MKKKLLLLTLTFFCFSLYAQSDFQLLAERGSKTRLYKPDAAVKILFRNADTIAQFRGRIVAVTADSIVLRHYQKSNDYRLSIAVTQLESVRRIRRVGRIITGVMTVPAVIGGIVLIADDSKEQGEFLDGLGTAVGAMFIASSIVPYGIVAATETVSAKRKGYKFRIVEISAKPASR